MASGSAPANGSPPASQSLRSTKSWTSASTNVNRCAGHLGVHTCCFRPEHASSTTTSLKSSVAATPPSGDHRPPTLPAFCDGLRAGLYADAARQGAPQARQELCGKVGDGVNQAADLIS